mmetsp:Transcript_50919/g.124055  ORF Transcript_50919/g.124055 Transcript_50919/m.124055 type:complete len:288 (-) Transcript_50919:1105-1968(-)
MAALKIGNSTKPSDERDRIQRRPRHRRDRCGGRGGRKGLGNWRGSCGERRSCSSRRDDQGLGRGRIRRNGGLRRRRGRLRRNAALLLQDRAQLAGAEAGGARHARRCARTGLVRGLVARRRLAGPRRAHLPPRALDRGLGTLGAVRAARALLARGLSDMRVVCPPRAQDAVLGAGGARGAVRARGAGDLVGRPRDEAVIAGRAGDGGCAPLRACHPLLRARCARRLRRRPNSAAGRPVRARSRDAVARAAAVAVVTLGARAALARARHAVVGPARAAPEVALAPCGV